MNDMPVRSKHCSGGQMTIMVSPFSGRLISTSHNNKGRWLTHYFRGEKE